MVFKLLRRVYVAVTIAHISDITHCFLLQTLAWIIMSRGKKRGADHKLIEGGDGGRRGASIPASSQGQADIWLDV